MWRMAPFVEAVLRQGRSAPAVAAAANLMRCRHEASRSRTKQRAFLRFTDASPLRPCLIIRPAFPLNRPPLPRTPDVLPVPDCWCQIPFAAIAWPCSMVLLWAIRLRLPTLGGTEGFAFCQPPNATPPTVGGRRGISLRRCIDPLSPPPSPRNVAGLPQLMASPNPRSAARRRDPQCCGLRPTQPSCALLPSSTIAVHQKGVC